MKPNLPVAKEGALTFLNAGHLDNEYFLVEFNNKVEVTEDYTTDLMKLQQHLTFLPGNKDKAAFDALYARFSRNSTSLNAGAK